MKTMELIMNKKFFALLILLCIFLFSSNALAGSGFSRYKFHIYEGPTFESPKKCLIEKSFSKIKIIKEDKVARWTKINYEGCEGWIVSNFILEEWFVNKYPEYKIQAEDGRLKEIKRLEELVLPNIPESEWKRKMKVYHMLSEWDPDNKKYKSMISHYEEQAETVANKKAAKREKAREEEIQRASKGYKLSLKNWSWSKSSDRYVTAKGIVKNITEKKLGNVKAMVVWFDADTNMITYSSSYIEFTTLMPGQSSPFSVMERYNPAMESANLSFKTNGTAVLFY